MSDSPDFTACPAWGQGGRFVVDAAGQRVPAATAPDVAAPDATQPADSPAADSAATDKLAKKGSK